MVSLLEAPLPQLLSGDELVILLTTLHLNLPFLLVGSSSSNLFIYIAHHLGSFLHHCSSLCSFSLNDFFPSYDFKYHQPSRPYPELSPQLRLNTNNSNISWDPRRNMPDIQIMGIITPHLPFLSAWSHWSVPPTTLHPSCTPKFLP